MLPVMVFVAHIILFGLVPDVLQPEAATVAANMRCDLAVSWTSAVDLSGEHTMKPHNLSTNCFEPAAMLVI